MKYFFAYHTFIFWDEVLYMTGENGIFKSYYNRHVCYVDIVGLLVAVYSQQFKSI